ncbi:hypothetical protein [Clostridium massiliodielmoense]|uniref:hypothetical protein n=1 Tax=Clostridium massiliodielmoense TaxID=1776385 RepID=UPI000A271F2A|nr:hypothetical protein [Clostridium massiliodielmoense]
MKLRELRPILRAQRVDLLLELAKPIQFEMFGVDDATARLAEYRPLHDLDERKNDTMFLDYGDYEIEAIYADEENDVINIDLKNVG